MLSQRQIKKLSAPKCDLLSSMIGLINSHVALTSTSLGLVAAAGSAEQYLDIASTIQAGLDQDVSPHELADQIAVPYYAIGEENNFAYVTAHSLLGQIVSGGSHESTRERLQLALAVIPPSVDLARLNSSESKDASSDYARSDTIRAQSESAVASVPASAVPICASIKPLSTLSKDLKLISMTDSENEMEFLSEVLSVKEGPLAEDVQFLAGLDPNQVSENIDLGTAYVGSGTLLNASLVRVLIELLRNEFTIPKNPGSMPDQAWANDVRLKASLMPKSTSHEPWKMDLAVKFELEVAHPNHLLIIMLSKHHSTYKTVSEKSRDESGDIVEKDSPTKVQIEVHYQGDIEIREHELRMRLRLVELEKGFTREEFGDLGFILTPQGLVLTMEKKAFSVNPDNFIRAIREGIERSLITDEEMKFQTLPSRTLPSAGGDGT